MGMSRQQLSNVAKSNPLVMAYLKEAAKLKDNPKAQQAMIEKAAISTGVFSQSGSLNAKQQNRFLKYVKDFAKLLNMARTHRLTVPSEDIDKMWAGEPITKPATEGATTGRVLVEPKFNKINLATTKIRSDWEISTESIQNAISQDQFEQDVFGVFMTRIASDLELLAILGDTTTTGSDPRSTLLAIKDGWYKQSLSGHEVDCGGASISKGVFAQMWKAMPKEYKSDPNLQFLVSENILTDWMDLIAERGTAMGDSALSGGEGAMRVYGKKITSIPYMPDDMTIDVGTATPATHKGVQAGPFKFTSSLTVILDVNSDGASTTTIAAGTYTVSQVAKLINDQLATDTAEQVAGDDGLGYLVLRTQTTGTGASIIVGAGTANTLLGLTAATYSGSAAGSNTDANGSFIWLVNPKNFIFGILDGTRIFSEFLRTTDQIGVTVFNQVDFKIENVDAVVVGTNVKARELF